MTQEEFAATLQGVSRGAVGNWERNKGIKTENLRQISARHQVSFDWLATARGPEPQKKGEAATQIQEGANGSVDVPEMEIRAGGGSGGFDPHELVEAPDGLPVAAEMVRDHWGIPAAFLRGQLRMEPGSVTIVEVYGDSMYDPANPGAPGSLYPGDRILVNLADRRPSPPGPFLVWDGVGLVVKLVEIVRGSDPAKIRLKSRNPSYDPYEATEDEAVIIGRVRGRISVM